MIKIITGKINSGKTTVLKQHFLDNKQGDGFISKKHMIKDIVHSYDIVKLSNQDSRLLVIREDFFDKKEEICCQIGPYLFLDSALSYVESEILNMIENNVSPIYLDEIGQLELYDQCFHNIFTKIVESNADCVITVRDYLIDKVIDKYNLKEIEIITI